MCGRYALPPPPLPPHHPPHLTSQHRYALAYPPADLAQRLIQDGLPVDEEPLAREVRSGYNIAPGSHQPVYRALPAGGAGTRYGLTAMRWG